MRWKTTLVLLIATLGVGSYVSFYELKQPSPEEQERLTKQIIRLPEETIARLQAEFPQAKVTLEHRDHSWRLSKPLEARADESRVRRLTNALNPLEAERVLEGSKDKPLALADFGLQPPRATLITTSGTQSTTFLFGEKTAVGTNRYLKLGDSPKVFVVSSNLFDLLDQPLESYRSHDVLDVETWAVGRLSVISATGSYTITKISARWQLTEPLADKADNAAVSGILSKLRGLQAQRFVSDSPQDARKPDWGFETSTARLTLFFEQATKPLELVVGKPTTDHPEQVYAKRSDEATVYAIAKDSLAEALRDPQTLRSRALLEVVASRVTKLHARWQDSSWTIEKRQGQWRAADGSALEGSHVEEWIRKLTDAQLSRFVEDQPKELARYGLDRPIGEVQAWEADQPNPRELLIGRAIDQGPSRYGLVSGRPVVIELPPDVNALLTITLDSLKSKPQAPSDHSS